MVILGQKLQLSKKVILVALNIHSLCHNPIERDFYLESNRHLPILASKDYAAFDY